MYEAYGPTIDVLIPLQQQNNKTTKQQNNNNNNNNKTVSAMVVRCWGTAYLPICGKPKLLLVLNPAAGVSFFIINKLINHTAFIESRHFVIVFIFVVIRSN